MLLPGFISRDSFSLLQSSVLLGLPQSLWYSAALLGAASPTEARDAVAGLASAVCSALHHPPQSVSEGSFLDNLYVYHCLEVLSDYSPTGVIWTPQDYSSLRPLKICLPALLVFQFQLSRKLEQEGRT